MVSAISKLLFLLYIYSVLMASCAKPIENMSAMAYASAVGNTHTPEDTTTTTVDQPTTTTELPSSTSMDPNTAGAFILSALFQELLRTYG
ncbi:hypothetical protein CDAR_414121 [Caerostris darwini]|uniref:Uncharacterized protein n=1 Tax=Caerostris darwini TaxID=1538125 RepID=A0AAV4RE63_9ARAC|nr:hypothetical protein CDAR_414121 [Caerostris darwini]